jgi:methylenetetrahydrofolate dehydrogenase (NADP+)/methenyltetrahydrofolate cyclohydrolase
MLLRRNASVTICHSRTENLEEITKSADIVICATGRPRAFGARYFSPGQTVLDVGINFDAHGNLCGDVDFDEVEPVVGAITPVPGGIGSVTTSTTMEHTVRAAELTLA